MATLGAVAGDVSSLALVAVDEVVLEALVDAATQDASADDVTPRLAGDSAWTPARIEWLRSFHRDRRAGLSGDTGEATWAVVVDGLVVGSVRLMRTTEEGVLETGIWLTRSCRGRRVGSLTMAKVLHQAVALGARGVRADTTRENIGAIKILRQLGFDVSSPHAGGRVEALLNLDELVL